MTTPARHPPLVTVAISCYNHQDYIEAAIESVLRQTYTPIELLVLDDGSRDDSVPRIRQLADKYGFFFEAQENMGLSATLNKALGMANGEYYVPFGSDDIMMLDRLEKQVAHMEENRDLSICAGNILKIDAAGNILPNRQKFHPAATLDFYDVFLERKSKGPAPTLLFRTDAIRKAGGFNPDIRLEDVYIQLSMTHQGHRIGFLNDVLAYYRTHPTNTYKDIDFMYRNVLKTYECFRDDSHYPVVRARFLNSMLVKASKKNKPLAREILSSIPLRDYKLKTLRGAFKTLFG